MLFNDNKLLSNLRQRNSKSYSFCYNLLTANSESDAINLLHKNYLSENTFYKYLNTFMENFDDYQNCDKAIIIMLDIYKKYLETFGIKTQEYSRKNNIKNQEQKKKYYNDKKEKILIDIFASGLSKEEYCFYHSDITLNKISEIFETVEENETTSEIIREIKMRNYDSIKKDLLEISYDIINGNYTLIDYFENCFLDPKDFIHMIYRWTNKEDYMKIRLFFKTYMEYRAVPLVMEKELEKKDIIKGVEITKEMKQNVYDYMLENNIPLKNYLFRVIIRNMVTKQLEKEKVKVKEK